MKFIVKIICLQTAPIVITNFSYSPLKLGKWELNIGKGRGGKKIYERKRKEAFAARKTALLIKGSGLACSPALNQKTGLLT